MKGLGAILRDHICGRSFTPYFYLQENYGSQEEHPWDIPIELDCIDAMHQRGVFELPGGEVHVDSASQASVTRLSLRLQMDPYVPFMVNRGYMRNAAHDEAFLSISGFPRSLYPNHGIVPPSPNVSSGRKEPRADFTEPAQSNRQAHTESSPNNLRSKLSSMRLNRPANPEQSYKPSRWSDSSSTKRGSQTTLSSVAELSGQDASSSRSRDSHEDEPVADKITEKD